MLLEIAMNPHSFPPPKIFTSASKMLLYILRSVCLLPDKPSVALSIDTAQKNHQSPKPPSFTCRHNDLNKMDLIFYPARSETDLPVVVLGRFFPATTQTAPGSKGEKTSKAF